MKKSISYETSETARNDKKSSLRRLESSETTLSEPEISPINTDVNFTLEQVTKSQRGSRGIALIFFNPLALEMDI